MIKLKELTEKDLTLEQWLTLIINEVKSADVGSASKKPVHVVGLLCITEEGQLGILSGGCKDCAADLRKRLLKVADEIKIASITGTEHSETVH